MNKKKYFHSVLPYCRLNHIEWDKLFIQTFYITNFTIVIVSNGDVLTCHWHVYID